jgi:hypothetical protein
MRTSTILAIASVLLAGGLSFAGGTTTSSSATTQKSDDRGRLVKVRAAVDAVYAYADRHDGRIPTTEQLAEAMGIATSEFGYVVVPDGLLKDHMQRQRGDWPEVLIREKAPPPAGGKWAFGFADGMCSVGTVEEFKEMHNFPVLKQIEEAESKN